MQIRHIIPHNMISSIFIESIYSSDLKPPASTKTAVYQWDKTIQNLTKEIGKSDLQCLTCATMLTVLGANFNLMDSSKYIYLRGCESLCKDR